MIISGTIVLDADGQATTSRELHARLADLVERRRAAATTVAALLDTWRGATATGFAERSAEWDDHAGAVLDALGASLAAIDLARADLLDADSRRGDAAAVLAGRLG